MLFYHVENRHLTPELMKRSVKIFVERCDPEKIYFLSEEIDTYYNMSDIDAQKAVSQVLRGDFSVYNQILSISQKSIARNRIIRSKLLEQMTQEETIELQYVDIEIFKAYSVSEISLKERVKGHLMAQVKIQAIRQNLQSLDSDQYHKALNLMNRRLNRFENYLLFQNSHGVSYSKAKVESIKATLILKSIGKSLDAHSAFLSPDEAVSIKASLQKQFKGIGVVLKEGFDGAYVEDLVAGGPAFKSGKIQKGDTLLKINNKSVKDLPFEEVMEIMRRSPGGKIHLVLLRTYPYEVVDVTLKKEVLTLDDDRLSYSSEPFAGGIVGKIKLTGFYDNDGSISAEKDLKNAIINLKKQGDLKGVVLDMRGNPGGFLSQAVKVAGLFIPKGVIVISKYFNGEMQYSRDIDGRLMYNGPLVILVSKASASAAEVVAQALQDYGVAIVVGDEHTYGKGSIQYINVLKDNRDAYYKVTIGRYYTISGRSTQIQGVESDIVVPTYYAPFQIGERYLQYPLSQDSLGFSFTEQNSLKSYTDPNQLFSSYFPKPELKWKKMLPQLKKNSALRIKQNSGYQQFFKQMDYYEKHHRFENNQLILTNEDLPMQEAVNIVKDMSVIDQQK